MNNTLLAQMQADVWAMDPKHLHALFMQVAEADFKMLNDIKVEVTRPTMSVNNGVATIQVFGVLMRSVPTFYRWYGIAATEYGDISAQISAAVNNPDVKSIVLDVDSPGGQVAGGMECASIIAAAAKKKTVTAKVENLCASGAYWLSSQATKIIANPNAMVGSIGVYMVITDYSKYAEDLGMKVHVIRSGEHKGAGVPGAEITEKQIDGFQEVIDGMADNFIAAVASGRSMTEAKARKVATGQTWLAAQAAEKGLVDTVIKLESEILSKGADMAENNTDNKQSPETARIKAAAAEQATTSERTRMTDLQAAFPGDLKFALGQFTTGASVETAKAAYCDIAQEKLKASEDKRAEAEAKTAAVEDEDTSGAPPMGSGGNEGTTEGADFMAVSRELAEEEKISVGAAMSIVARKQPELHKAFLSKKK